MFIKITFAMSTQELEFDDFDMENLDPRFNLPPPRPIESLEALIRRVGQRPLYSNEETRRSWMRTVSERDKAVKNLQLIDQKIEHWVKKRNSCVSILERLDRQLQEIEPRIISDIVTR